LTTGENYVARSFVVLYLRQMLCFGQIQEDEMGEACGMCGSEWKYIQSFGGEAWRIETSWESKIGFD
jgi:hypothetical protein